MLFKIIVASRENTTLKCCCSKYGRILERVNEWLIVEEIIICKLSIKTCIILDCIHPESEKEVIILLL